MKVIESGINPLTGGYYAFFEHNGKEYYADLCYLPCAIDFGTECMIFASEDKQVTSWSELYCKMGIAVDEDTLLRCIEEFVDNEAKEVER